MKQRSVVLLVLAAACASQEAPAKPEAPASPATAAADGKTPASKPAPAAADGKAPASKPAPREEGTAWTWRSEATPAATPTYLVGLMGQSGTEHCPGGGAERKWLSLRPAIGRVSVSGPDDAVLEPLMDRPVLALGLPGDPPPRAEGEGLPPKVEACLPAQMRSDWRTTPRGILIERSPSPSLSHLRMEAVRPLHELAVRKDGDHVVVTLQNPVPVVLSGVELRVHYEGCFGKPGTRAETTAVGELGVGAQASARMPQLSANDGAPEGTRDFRAHSVQLVAQGEGVVIDLDVPFSDLGLETKCPGD